MKNWTIDGSLDLQNLDIMAPDGRIAMIDCDDEDTPDETIRARAHLIAAAPDLLEALRDLVEAATHHQADARAALAKAREAIAKATGAA